MRAALRGCDMGCRAIRLGDPGADLRAETFVFSTILEPWNTAKCGRSLTQPRLGDGPHRRGVPRMILSCVAPLRCPESAAQAGLPPPLGAKANRLCCGLPAGSRSLRRKAWAARCCRSEEAIDSNCPRTCLALSCRARDRHRAEQRSRCAAFLEEARRRNGELSTGNAPDDHAVAQQSLPRADLGEGPDPNPGSGGLRGLCESSAHCDVQDISGRFCRPAGPKSPRPHVMRAAQEGLARCGVLQSSGPSVRPEHPVLTQDIHRHDVENPAMGRFKDDLRGTALVMRLQKP